jgi:hypothetical protein
MTPDTAVPTLPELLRSLFTYYPATAIGSLSALVVGTAGVIQTLNTLVYNRTKATYEFLEKQLAIETQTRRELERKLDEKIQKNDPDVVRTDTRAKLSPLKYIKILAIVSLVMTLASIPFGHRVRVLIAQYAQASSTCQTNIDSLQYQLGEVSAPFAPAELLRVLKTAPTGDSHGKLDGHSYDLDMLANRRFVYRGEGPAVLVGSSIRGLVITAPKGEKVLFIIKPETNSVKAKVRGDN